MPALSCTEYGPESGPTLIFLHGGGVSRWMWDDVVRVLPEYHCLVPDLPGHGYSLDLGEFSFDLAVETLAELIESKAHDGKAHLIGLSLGAQTALAFMGAHPDRVLSAFISGALVRPLPGAGMMGALMALYGPFKDMPVMIRANMKQLDVPERHYEAFARDTKLLTNAAFAAILRENMSFGLPVGLDEVQIPVLVVYGEREAGVMKKSAYDLAGALPDARIRVAAGLGHNWPLEVPQKFAEAVRTWVEGDSLPETLQEMK